MERYSGTPDADGVDIGGEVLSEETARVTQCYLRAAQAVFSEPRSAVWQMVQLGTVRGDGLEAAGDVVVIPVVGFQAGTRHGSAERTDANTVNGDTK